MRLQMPEPVPPRPDPIPVEDPPPGDDPPVEIPPPGDDPTQPPAPVRFGERRISQLPDLPGSEHKCSRMLHSRFLAVGAFGVGYATAPRPIAPTQSNGETDADAQHRPR